MAAVLATVVVAAMLLITGVPAAAESANEMSPQSLPAAEPFVDRQVIFQHNTNGYDCFRIPAIVRGNDGTLLAFAEGRVDTCDDWGDIDVVLRRSTDGGRTWGPIQVIDEGHGGTSGNPVPVVDRATGRIAVVTTHNPPGPCGSDCDRDFHLLHSEDNGRTWTEPEELADAKRPEWSGWAGTGPAHGVQLTRGKHAGRMIIGTNAEYVAASGRTVKVQYLLYSDDGGLSWQIGAETSSDDGVVIAGELTVVELTDGRIYVQARDAGTAKGTRSFAISSDGGESFLPAFDEGFRPLPDLVTPEVESSILRYGAREEGDSRDRILWSGPAHPTTREVLTIRSSYDEADTWETWDEGKVIDWGPSAYSDLVRLDRDRIGLLYENGPVRPYDTLTFVRMNEAYLDTPNPTPPGIPPAPQPGPTTPDLSDNANTAYLRGSSTVAGQYGKALRLDGNDDAVELPLTGALDLAAKDFTFAAWFRYTETTGSRAILWGYRMNRAPQVWLRAEPQNNRIRAHLHVGTGSVTLSHARAYNDGRWHHVALRRAGGNLIMTVDGTQVAAAAAPAGSVTSGGEFGIGGLRLGQRIDGADDFRGDLDDVWLFKRALTDAELDRLRAGHGPQRNQLSLQLPLDRVDPE